MWSHIRFVVQSHKVYSVFELNYSVFKLLCVQITLQLGVPSGADQSVQVYVI